MCVFYRSGSIKVEMTLVFDNSSIVPSSVEVEAILNRNTMNGTIPLNIILDTIKAGECVKYNTQISIMTKPLK